MLIKWIGTYVDSSTNEHDGIAAAAAVRATDGRGSSLNKRLDLLHARVHVVDGGRARGHAVLGKRLAPPSIVEQNRRTRCDIKAARS